MTRVVWGYSKLEGRARCCWKLEMISKELQFLAAKLWAVHVIPRNLKSELQFFTEFRSPLPCLPSQPHLSPSTEQSAKATPTGHTRLDCIAILIAFIARQNPRHSAAVHPPLIRAKHASSCGDYRRDRIFISIWADTENPCFYLDNFLDFFLLDHHDRAPSS
jgi:hypothetical protein